MDSFATAEAGPAPELRERQNIPDRFKWDLAHIFSDWGAWQAAYDELETRIGAYAALQGTLDKGPDRLLAAMQLSDEIGQLMYKVWCFASLKYEDQRDNTINARRQQVQILLRKPPRRARGSTRNC
jgi:oligoendopeptidase F